MKSLRMLPVAGVLVVSFWLQTHQVAVKAAPAKNVDRDFARNLTLSTDFQTSQQVETARAFIAEKSWGNAARMLQLILESKEDHWVLAENQSGEVVWRGAWAEAHRLASTLPPEGVRAFHNLVNGTATRLLKESEETRDFQKLAEVAHRYHVCEAGFEATTRLATYCLYQGNFARSADCFDKLLSHPLVQRNEGSTMVKALIAYRRAGEDVKEKKLWARLEADHPRGLPLNQKVVDLKVVRDEIDRLAEPVEELKATGSMFRGDATRQGILGDDVTGVADLKWQVELSDQRNPATAKIEAALRQQPGKPPVLPGAHPIACGDMVVYRGPDGLNAVNIKKDGKLQWSRRMAQEAGEPLSLQHLLDTVAVKGTASEWLRQFEITSSLGSIIENSNIGTLSTNGKLVFAVQDLAVPPTMGPVFPFGGRQQNRFGRLEAEVKCNMLQGFGLESGKLKWEVGGPRVDANDPFAETYFLGAPLPVADKLYVLAEKDSKFALVCLDAAKGKHAWTQTLALSTVRLPQDVTRRVSACPLSYADGILVCPTACGAVFGVDPLTRGLIWAHSYDEAPAQAVAQPRVNPQQGVKFQLDLKFSAPIIAQGKVIFSTPDASGVHCLNLRDGQEAWKPAKNRDDLYVAGVQNGKVLIVGRTRFRAIDLKTGLEQWNAKIPAPTGLGVLSKNCYYLPARDDREPAEICVIDLNQKAVKERLRPKKLKDINNRDIEFGNLIVHQGAIITQTARVLNSFPIE